MSTGNSFQKRSLLLVLACLCWLVSYLFTTPVNEHALEVLSNGLESQIEVLQEKLEAQVEDLMHEARNENSSHWNALDEVLNQDGRYFLVAEAWSAQAACLDTELPERFGSSAIQLKDGVYLHTFAKDEYHKVHGLQKILQDPPYENRYLTKGAHQDLDMPNGVQLVRRTNGAVLHASDGSMLCGIEWKEPTAKRVVSSWAWFLRVVAMLLLLPIIWKSGMLVFKRAGTWAGIVFGISIAALLGYLAPKLLADSGELFDPSLYATSAVLASLGHLLIIAIMTLFAAVFIREVLSRKAYTPSLYTMGISLVFLLLLARLIAVVMVGSVHDSTIDLNLFEIQYFDRYSLIAIFSSALFLGAWVILAYAFIDQWWPSRLTKSAWGMLAIIAACSVVAHHLFGVKDTVFMFWPFVIVLVFYYKGPEHLRSVKLIIVVAVIATFNAHVLNKHAVMREAQDRVVMAERLATIQDPILERLYNGISANIRSDTTIIRLLSDDTPCPIQEVDDHLRGAYFTEGFWERYAITVNVFDGENSLRCDVAAGNTASWEDLYDLYVTGYDVSGAVDLHVTDSSYVEALYVSMLPITKAGEAAISGYLFLRFTPRSAPEELGFPELLLAGEDPLDTRIKRYAYSEYRQGMQVRQFGENAYPIRWERPVNEGPNWLVNGSYKDLVYVNGSILIVLGTRLPGLLDKATTFSYLFMFFVIIAVLLAVVWWFIAGEGGITWTLRAKVRTTLLLFVLIGSVFFGFGARKLLVDSFAQTVDNDLREKTHSVLVELQHKLGDREQFTDEMKHELDYLLSKFSKVFFSDITLYKLDGSLLATSRPQLFDAGLLGQRMAPNAFQALALRRTSEFIHNEHIGALTYRSAYVPFINDKGHVLAYLDLPYFARQNELDNGLSALLIAIVNLFVLLFALSMLVAVFISNWTTRPLAILETSLSKIDLASTNAPLKYSGRDEIGHLVEVYNNKVNELKESAERLARSERETAWREMAKQVAHEIKNPLTPMKLSIQHFERTWDPEAVDAQEKLSRFSNGLVSQIDSLSSIAEEFAHFAKMPSSDPVEMDLAVALRSAIDLFKGNTQVAIIVDIAPDLNARVIADNEHMVRVFNNLIKNAMESIPEEKQGQITVRMWSEEGQVQVSVRDNGNGIPAEIQERIFMPNFTTRSTGMGLGLAMVKRMVETPGGKVWFESTIGQGTTFYVSIPKAS